MTKIKIRNAVIDESLKCIFILKQAANWVNKKGTLLWCTEWFTDDYLDQAIKRNEVFVVTVDDQIVALFLLQNKDITIWPEKKADTEANYIHKLCVLRQFAGTGISDFMNWIVSRSQKDNKKYVRLDCARRNKLIAIYAQHGFEKRSSFNMKRAGLPDYRGVKMELKL